MNFEIYLNNTWLDLSNDIKENSIKIQKRADEAFGQGQFELLTSLISYNIPPYTICKMINGNAETYFVCSSQASKYLSISGLWAHQVTIMEATALLECFVLGSKFFSVTGTNKNDASKMSIILSLISNKYGWSFISYLTGLNNENEYNFGAGTTMYAAINEILTRYGYRVKVTQIDVATNKIYLNKVSNDAVSINDMPVLSVVYSQNSDNYGKYLETEAQNVVDRDSSITYHDLTCRSENVALTADEAKIILPCSVEAITSLTAKDYNSAWYITIICYSAPTTHANDNLTYYTWATLINEQWAVGGKANFWQWIYETIAENFTASNTISGLYLSYNSGTITAYFYNSTNPAVIFYSEANYFLDDYIVEESYWNTLSVSDKPKYLVYKSGGNSIYNLNTEYKGDFINQILGTTVYNILNDYSKTYTLSDNSYIKFKAPNNHDKTPMGFTYDVTCVPITNPVLIDIKKDTPRNESSWKNFTRTYNKSGNPIDFNLLVDSMSKINAQSGKQELTLELDTTSSSIPEAGCSITYDNKTWYVMCVDTSYHKNKIVSILACCDSYYKIADAIGVAYQFNPTKNPIDTYITRPLFYEAADTTLAAHIQRSLNLGCDIIARVIFYYSSGNSALLKRCAVSTDDNNYYLYLEALDNYAFDKRVIERTGTDECRDVAYGDSNNEVVRVGVTIYSMLERVSKTASINFPYSTAGFTTSSKNTDSLTTQIVYKDAREKLTFTIKCPKA